MNKRVQFTEQSNFTVQATFLLSLMKKFKILVLTNNFFVTDDASVKRKTKHLTAMDDLDENITLLENIQLDDNVRISGS